MGGGIKWRETVPEGAQILDLLDADFKSTVLSVLKELKENRKTMDKQNYNTSEQRNYKDSRARSAKFTC